jgi:hypothetical protein
MEVVLSDGKKVVLRKPTAGVRNKAAVKAETKEGIKQTTFMVELLPFCIATHEWGVTPVRQALDDLSIDDYDKLVDTLGKLMKPQGGDVEKKLEPSSTDQE